MSSSPEDILNKLFPIDTSEGSAPLGDLTLGFDDFSDDSEASALLLALPEEAIALVHRYVFADEVDAVDHIDNLRELIDSLDARDPYRRLIEPTELVKKEIDGVRSFFQLILKHDKLPMLVDIRHPGSSSSDTTIAGWFVCSTDLDLGRGHARKYIGLLDVMEAFLRDPVSHREQYDEATSLYIDDVLPSGGPNQSS